MVIVDAGHGGSDPGASSGDIVEKDYTLKIANYMYNRFKELGIPTVITRTGDTTLNPTDRINVIKPNITSSDDIVISNHLRTNGEVALQASKAVTDFGVNLSTTFNSNIQYLNSQAAQSLFTSKENNPQAAFSIENTQKAPEDQVVLASSQVSETKNMNKDKRGSNPFSFYMPAEQKAEKEEPASIFTNSINIFA